MNNDQHNQNDALDDDGELHALIHLIEEGEADDQVGNLRAEEVDEDHAIALQWA